VKKHQEDYPSGLPQPLIDPALCLDCGADVCVLAAVMDAVDAGYRVVLAADALCSVSDESHDAMLRHFGSRFSQQIEVASTEEILADWRKG
jgi:nicotinamidase-related amidase